MEKKTTQRIIGVLVIAALIIVLLPLLFDGNTATSQTTAVKAPPFPDQHADAATTESAVPATSEQNAQSSFTISNNMSENMNSAQPSPATMTTTITEAKPQPVAPEPVTTPAPAAPAPITQPPVATSSTEATTQPAPSGSPAVVIKDHMDPADMNAAATAAPTNPPIVTAPPVKAPVAVVQPTATPTPSMQKPEAAPEAVKPVVTEVKPVVAEVSKPKMVASAAEKHVKSVKKMKTVKHVHTHKELVQLKNPAWAVQMGSFRVKSNAVRLTNRLRSLGFKAFTREHGDSLRVYVGPEFQQASAASLIDKIQHDINMRGIMVPYRPLEI